MADCDGRLTYTEEMPEVYVNVPLAKKLEENYKLVGEKVVQEPTSRVSDRQTWAPSVMRYPLSTLT